METTQQTDRLPTTNYPQVPRRTSSRRFSSTRQPPQTARSVADLSSRAAEGVQRRGSAPTGSQQPIVVRKRLPWLDGPSRPGSRRIPGEYHDSRDSLDIPEASTSTRPDDRPPYVSPPTRPPVPALEADPAAARSIGYAPSFRDRPRFGDSKTLSLNSQPRSVIRPPISRRDADEALEAVNEPKRSLSYSSSEYSARHSVEEEREQMPSRLPTRDPASYERLVNTYTSKPPKSRSPVYLSREGFKSRATLPNDRDLSPRQYARPRRNTNAGQSWQEPVSSSNQWPLLREVPRARTATRRSVAAPRPGPSPPRPPAGPPRKPTLFTMPTHLMGSSSSSLLDSSTPANVSPVRPPIPPPRRSSSHRDRRPSDSLSHAVNGLENLMEEAMSVARNAAQRGQNEELASILDNATAALRRASTVSGQMHSRRSVQPLVLSPIGSARGSESESSVAPDSDVFTHRSRHQSVDTAATLLTKSARSVRQPYVVDEYQSNGQKPRSMKAEVEDVRDRPPLSDDSLAKTPPRLYQPPSADSVIRDFAYKRAKTARAEAARALSKSAEWGLAAEYYGDNGQSVRAQPGVRPSINPPMLADEHLFGLPPGLRRPSRAKHATLRRAATDYADPRSRQDDFPPRRPSAATHTGTMPTHRSTRQYERLSDSDVRAPRRRRDPTQPPQSHIAHLFESPYYRSDRERALPETGVERVERVESARSPSAVVTDTRYDEPPALMKQGAISEDPTRYSGPTPTLLRRNVSLKHPRRKHISLLEGQGFSLGRYHRRQPIAREWSTARKRITATIACMNTVFIGLIAGIYAGQVPRMQYQLADTTHKVILGNVLLFACLGVTTIIFWPLPLLHGRKPYTLLGMALIVPLLFPQALSVTGYHAPTQTLYRCGLLIPRVFMGIALGFANINFLPTLFDLFGASLMSEMPHQEIVVYDDVRRQGGGVGVWLGIWSFCFVGSMSIGFMIGAVIISSMDPSWGFYIIVILLAFFLLVNVIAPETRRSPYRRSIAQFLDGEDNVKRRVARGEIKLHISNEGPKFWWQEVWAGIVLTKRMALQPGFFILMMYLGWMYAQVTLVILLLGALLSRDYKWQPQYVGGAVSAMAIGAFLAMPLSKANLFSRARDRPQRTDSMTMRHGRVTWSSHMLRRCAFTLFLPLAATAYTVSSPGPSVSWAVPTVFTGLVGFLSNLAIAECVGLIMETFDTCDLQPGVNSKHRLQSLAETTRRRRTNYSSFPRVCAGFFAAQGTGFILSAAATGVSGDVTRAVGAQISTAIVAGILLVLTVLFIAVLWRWKEVQVVPNNPFGAESKGGIVWGPAGDDPEWKPVIIGNPSGKMRRVNLLELGGLSRWTEIRKLNKLIHD